MQEISILVLDDSNFARMVLARLIQEATADIKSIKVNVIELDTAQSALDYLEHQSVDIALLDVILPEGIEAGVHVLEVVTEKKLAKITFMFSSIADKSLIGKCQELGATQFFIKPFNNKEIKTALRKEVTSLT